MTANKNDHDRKIETELGLVGPDQFLDGGFADTAREVLDDVVGGKVNFETDDSDISVEAYGGLTLSGDIQIGAEATKNLYNQKPDKNTGDFTSINAVSAIAYNSRAGGITSSLGIQIEAMALEGQLKLQAEGGYQISPEENHTGTYFAAQADYDLSKDACVNFMDKGCLTNVTRAVFNTEGYMEVKNTLFHDVDLGLRVGPSIQYDSEHDSVTAGIDLRVQF